MLDVPVPAGSDLLRSWVAQHDAPTRAPRFGRRPTADVGSLRFAFYGRISTDRFQDPRSSTRWQRDFAQELIAGHGRIVAEFFDVGCSRAVEWADRPQAALLLQAITSPARTFDAIVVGEFERAFYGDQFLRLAPTFASHGVAVWLPELDGPADPSNQIHLAVPTLLAAHSKREVQRARLRAKAAMRAQIIEQGRHLGGRPPYGYRLGDAGPHPNAAHARWGRRAHRLEPDPDTAPHVQWIFAQRLAGHALASIARDLNDRGIPCPSAADPARNPHRHGNSWYVTTVAAILANPRYTGRQVWNKQRTEHGRPNTVDDLLGLTQARRWNLVQQWVVSPTVAHPPLVSEQDFIQAQTINATPSRDDGNRSQYLLAGLIRCRVCGRALDSHWVNHHAAYRCRHGRRGNPATGPKRPRSTYVHERNAINQIAAQLGLPCVPTAVAHHMREHDLLAYCDIGGEISTQPAAIKPATIPQQRQAPEPHGR